MALINSARNQLVGIIPTGPDAPVIPTHLAGIVNAIEPHMVLWANDLAAANASLTPLVNKMVLVTNTAIYLRLNNVWNKIWPTNFSGTAIPNPANFEEGDTYDRYVA